MKDVKYTAGAVGKGFWFLEFKSYIQLINKGLSAKEIREIQKNENVLLAPSDRKSVV